LKIDAALSPAGRLPPAGSSPEIHTFLNRHFYRIFTPPLTTMGIQTGSPGYIV